MQLLKLVEQEVRIGVPLPWNVRNQDGNLLLAKHYAIQNAAQLDMLLERGMYVDLEEIHAVAALQALAPIPAQSLYARWANAVDVLEAVLPTLAEAPAALDQLHTLAAELLELAALDADIALFMAVRQDQTRHLRYGYSHAVCTSLVALLMAQRLSWTPERVRQLVLAALTMNASIAELQGQMAHQEHPLLDRQRAQISRHPQESAERLQRAGVTDGVWLAAVREHHERTDGTGYPTGMGAVSEVARVLRMADIFMARISPRTFRPAMPIQEAARQMFRDDKGGPLAMALMKELGIYPPGDLVQLASGELGVVVRRGAEARTPLVAAVTDAQGRSITTTLQRDTANPAYAIVGPATDRAMLARVSPERLYGYGVA